MTHESRDGAMPVSGRLLQSRFRGDETLLDTLRSDDRTSGLFREGVVSRHRQRIRMRLLATAVRVDPDLTPSVFASIEQVRARAGLDIEMEAYVHQEPSINAFVTRGRRHLIVVLSSGAVNRLSEAELDFVIGHELGHAMYGHVDVPVSLALDDRGLDPRSRMQVLAWKRAAEISADRAGLISCGALETAASAMFKTISGLDLHGVRIDPVRFADQWAHLEREVMDVDEPDTWRLSHPFPPLRVRALMLFDASERAKEETSGVDREVERLLAMMDPVAREGMESADPLLADLLLWGGLALAVADGRIDDDEVAHLATVVPQASLREVLDRRGVDVDYCRTQFKAAIDRRERRLRALEVHRILQGLLHVARADGEIEEREIATLQQLGELLGVDRSGCDLLVSKYMEEM